MHRQSHVRKAPNFFKTKNKEHARRVKDPTDSVVNRLGLGEGLVSTLVRDYPQTRREKTRPETVQCPDGETRQGVQNRVGKCES